MAATRAMEPVRAISARKMPFNTMASQGTLVRGSTRDSNGGRKPSRALTKEMREGTPPKAFPLAAGGGMGAPPPKTPPQRRREEKTPPRNRPPHATPHPHRK